MVQAASSNAPRPAIENLDELPFVSEVYKRFLHTPDYFYGHSLWPLVVFAVGYTMFEGQRFGDSGTGRFGRSLRTLLERPTNAEREHLVAQEGVTSVLPQA